jgi:hypothetical protein
MVLMFTSIHSLEKSRTWVVLECKSSIPIKQIVTLTLGSADQVLRFINEASQIEPKGIQCSTTKYVY